MPKLILPKDRALLAPGVFDALSALVAERAGAEALYLSGASLSYTQIGRPDLGFVDLTRVADATRRIADRVAVPLVVDADTGFGNALNVQHTVRLLEAGGAAAVQIEDQAMPKRCGHLSGKSVISAREMAGKVKAAVDARRDAATLVVARTDALAVEGFDAAIERAALYAEAGADVLFVEALRTEEEMRKAARLLSPLAPLLANMVEGGRTPLRTREELAAMGFRLVIAPGALARAYAFLAEEFFAQMLRDGGTAASAGRMKSFDEINRLIGLPELLDAGSLYDGEPRRAAE